VLFRSVRAPPERAGKKGGAGVRHAQQTTLERAEPLFLYVEPWYRQQEDAHALAHEVG
jgi:hypothetical protein